MINHRGRKTGRQYQAMVEVVEREKQTNHIIVVAGYDEQSQWYKNLRNQSETVIQIGNDKFTAFVDLIAPKDGEDFIARYME